MATETIHQWRLRLGLAQSALGSLAKVNAALISLHENGHRYLSPSANRECMMVLQSIETLQACLPGKLDVRDVNALGKTLRDLWDGKLGAFQRLAQEESAARAGIAAAGEDEESGPRVIDTSYLPATVPQNAK